MSIGKDKIRISLVIDSEDKQLLQEIAKREGRSLNNLINQILRKHIASQKQDPK